MIESFRMLPKRIPIKLGGNAIVLLFGIVPIIYSLFLASQSLFWAVKGVPTTGTVVRLVTGQDDQGNTAYYPVIRFKTAEGATVEFQSSDGSSPPQYSVGDTLPIRYEQGQPQNARTADSVSLSFLTFVPFCVGILFILVGLSMRKPGSRFYIRPTYVFGIFFITVGLCFLAAGIFVAVQTRQLEQRTTASATGTVINCVYGNTGCIPTIRFTPANGAAVTFQPSSSDDNLQMGESVSVRYNPADPKDARLASSSNFVLPFIFGGLGGVFFLIGLVVGVIALRNRHRPDTGVEYADDTETDMEYADDAETDIEYADSTKNVVSSGTDMKSLVILFGFFLFMAITFCGVGVICLNLSTGFQSTATSKAVGTIVSCDSVDNSNDTSGTSCSPTIRFVTSEGRTIEFIPSEASSSFEVGQSIPVFYDPQAPEQAQISSSSDFWMLPIVFLAFGSIFIILTCVCGFFIVKRIFVQKG